MWGTESYAVLWYTGRFADAKKYVNDFFKDMVLEYNIASYSSLIDTNQYVISWLTIMGYEEEIHKYQSLVSLVSSLEENYECRTKVSKMVK